jgi:DNA-binding ferritin-like protein (Dps family)
MARVKALPQDYRIVYNEFQNYLFKVGIYEQNDWSKAFSGLVDLFEEGAMLGKGVLEVTGEDVASFCDELLNNTKL